MKKIILDLTKPKQEVLITEDSEIYGVFMGHGQEKLTTEITIRHKKPNLKSLTMIKAVVFDKSVFDITGNLVIDKGAKFTDAYLKLEALIMSRDAMARVVPSLEITENDVKGGHGATVGQVDQEQLFYLQSRGLSTDQAENELVKGFLGEITTKIAASKVAPILL